MNSKPLLAGRILLVCVATLLGGRPALAAPLRTLWVDHDSQGGPCNDGYSASDNAAANGSKPWCTLSAAGKAARAGDLVTVRGGTYKEPMVCREHPGMFGVLRARAGEEGDRREPDRLQGLLRRDARHRPRRTGPAVERTAGPRVRHLRRHQRAGGSVQGRLPRRPRIAPATTPTRRPGAPARPAPTAVTRARATTPSSTASRFRTGASTTRGRQRPTRTTSPRSTRSSSTGRSAPSPTSPFATPSSSTTTAAGCCTRTAPRRVTIEYNRVHDNWTHGWTSPVNFWNAVGKNEGAERLSAATRSTTTRTIPPLCSAFRSTVAARRPTRTLRLGPVHQHASPRVPRATAARAERTPTARAISASPATAALHRRLRVRRRHRGSRPHPRHRQGHVHARPASRPDLRLAPGSRLRQRLHRLRRPYACCTGRGAGNCC